MMRRAIEVRGTVQGVGFRPFVFGLAARLGLTGFVLNEAGRVRIEVEGEAGRVEEFTEELRLRPPPLARIEEMGWEVREPVGDREFRIERSLGGDGESGSNAGGEGTRPASGAAKWGAGGVAVSADVGVCADCLREMWDVGDRRYRYPFLNCTNCGPRLTIIRGVPYDRERTTMAGFEMCGACREEYEDPRNRRFHAQPTACPVCGPRLSAADAGGKRLEMGDPIKWFAGEILKGKIGAMKGLGGYHLVCDAGNAGAVAELRRRKGREEKPFAVMVRDVAEVEGMCWVSGEERELLESVRRPIMLLGRREAGSQGDRMWTPGPRLPNASGTEPSPRRFPGVPGERAKRQMRLPWAGSVVEGVAPGNPELGVMLPYTPLHHLLMEEVGGRALVMTSGNRSDEPIAIGEPEVFERLGGIADLFLTHDRGIHVRCDDSVTRVMGGHSHSAVNGWTFGQTAKREGRECGESVVRRSRGYAPEVTPLPVTCPMPILAVGGQMKGTFALAEGGRAIVSHHLGDLDHFEAYRAFERDVELYERLFEIRPACVVHDLHPDYASTRYAIGRGKRERISVVGVQHHHAHVASCMVEHGLIGPVIGVSFDGTGYGTDGAVWGGEFLVADLRGFRRAGHLRYVAMPGGERAIREPWRMGVAHLADAGVECGRFGGRLREEEVRVVKRMMERGINSPWTSSMGRLFDAVAAIVGVRDRVTFEGQASMELEWVARKNHRGDAWCWEKGTTSNTQHSTLNTQREHASARVDEYIHHSSRHNRQECLFHQDEQTRGTLRFETPDEEYAAEIVAGGAGWVVDTRGLVRGVVRDVEAGVEVGRIARRFHGWAAGVIREMCVRVREETGINEVVLSGGVFMNSLLAEEAATRLRGAEFCAFRHRSVPTNDGGISLGQVAVAACRMANGGEGQVEGVGRVPRDPGPSGQDVLGA